MLSLRDKIKAIAASIQKIDGMTVTFYLSVGYSLFSEDEDLAEQTQKAEIRLLADHDEHTSTGNRMTRSSQIFHVYDDLPITYSVYEVLVNKENQVYDAVVFYVNHKFEQRCGMTAEQLLGRRTRELFPLLDEEWYEKAQRAALLGETVFGRMYYEPTGKHYYMTASQVIHSGYCCFTYQETDEMGNSLE